MSRDSKGKPPEATPPPKEPEVSQTVVMPRPMNAAEATPVEKERDDGYSEVKLSKIAREKILTHIEKESENAITERGQMIEIMGKLAVAEADKNRLLEIFDKSRQREGLRRNDFEASQRQIMWLLMAAQERDHGYINDLLKGYVDLAGVVGEMKQASKESKIAEIAEAATIILQIPIVSELTGMMLDKLRKKRALKDPAKEKLRRKLQQQLDALQDEDSDDDDSDE